MQTMILNSRIFMISQVFYLEIWCVSHPPPQVICEPSTVDLALELWWLLACRFSSSGFIRSCLLFAAVAGFSYGLWTHRAWRQENVSDSAGCKYSVSRGIYSGTTTVGVQTVLEGPVSPAFHETGPAGVVRKSVNLAREALGKKKKGPAGVGPTIRTADACDTTLPACESGAGLTAQSLRGSRHRNHRKGLTLR